MCQLTYNADLRTHLRENADERIEHLVAHFRQRGVHFMWRVHSTAQTVNLAKPLERYGLSLVEQATGMLLDLCSWQPLNEATGRPVSFTEVSDEQSLRDYEELIVRYWELPKASRPYMF